MSESKPRRTPAPRLLIVAAPLGLYLGITRAAEEPVADAAATGGIAAVAVLAAPALMSGAGKAAAAASARKKAKSKAKKKTDDD
ncbi:hypothetical protein [Streptomyces griseoaurantiacus]|uniref:hypothetical protein n=1 Tax=Streptomyces griseoaurantiacus TaxID=68213 RepID=UPI002E2AFF46|nr:hypothetical protein [Streptomyces jietaisiensis]